MIEIRRYHRSAHVTVFLLHKLALDAVEANAGDGTWDDDLHAIEAVYLNNAGEFLVGEKDGLIVAMGALRRTTAERAEIKRMRVHPDYQRRGFGQQILDSLEERARELGYTTLRLDTTEKQIGARRLYEKNGYALVGQAQIFNHWCLLYEKVLSSRTRCEPAPDYVFENNRVEEGKAVAFRPLSKLEAEAITEWRYSGEYSVYDIPDENKESSIQYMIDPGSRFLGVYEELELIGFCSLGADGQVPGGTYDGSAVDVGAGMRPDLIGKNYGRTFLRCVIDYVESSSELVDLRTTIASWNKRALRAAQSVGFIPQFTFVRPDGTEFTVLVRTRTSNPATTVRRE